MIINRLKMIKANALEISLAAEDSYSVFLSQEIISIVDDLLNMTKPDYKADSYLNKENKR